MYLSLVTSTKAHAKILKVDPSEALSMPGVVSYISHEDVPGHNHVDIYGQGEGEPIFAANTVTCQGQVIGAIVADTKKHAQEASRYVNVLYEELPAIITIEVIRFSPPWNCGLCAKAPWYCFLNKDDLQFPNPL